MFVKGMGNKLTDCKTGIKIKTRLLTKKYKQTSENRAIKYNKISQFFLNNTKNNNCFLKKKAVIMKNLKFHANRAARKGFVKIFPYYLLHL